MSTLEKSGHAGAIQVPFTLQADLLAKVAGYDRNLPRRSAGRVKTFLVFRAKDADSTRAAQSMKSAMSAVPTIGNLPHDEDLIPFSTSKDLIASCTRLGPSILYFGPGFDEELGTLRTLFESLDLLTVSANPEGVPLGLVLGFDLVSGRPKLLVNLTQARKQGVAFQPEVLKLMKVVA